MTKDYLLANGDTVTVMSMKPEEMPLQKEICLSKEPIDYPISSKPTPICYCNYPVTCIGFHPNR